MARPLARTSVETVQQEPGAQLRLEPGRLRRHDLAGIRHPEQVLDGRGVHRKRHGVPSTVDPLYELPRTANPAHEVDALVAANVTDAQNRPEHTDSDQRVVERSDRVIGIDA